MISVVMNFISKKKKKSLMHPNCHKVREIIVVLSELFLCKIMLIIICILPFDSKRIFNNLEEKNTFKRRIQTKLAAAVGGLEEEHCPGSPPALPGLGRAVSQAPSARGPTGRYTVGPVGGTVDALCLAPLAGPHKAAPGGGGGGADGPGPCLWGHGWTWLAAEGTVHLPPAHGRGVTRGRSARPAPAQHCSHPRPRPG